MRKSAKWHKSAKVHYYDEKILSMLQAYNNHYDLTVKEFCKLHKIHKSTFYNWRKLYGDKNIVGDKPKGFLPLEVASPSYGAPSDIPTLFAEVNGIRHYHFVPADYLKALLS